MRLRLCLAILLFADSAMAASIDWSGAADSNYFNAANWVGGVAPGLSDTPNFPATATSKTVNLGGGTASHSIITIGDGYIFSNGRLQVQGGGTQSEIRGSGTSTLNVNFGSYGDGNGVKFVQNAAGTLTINGSRGSAIKPFSLNAGDPNARIVFAGTTTSPSKGHGFSGVGWLEVTAAARLTGGGSTDSVNVTGRLLFNGIENATNAKWSVNGTTGAIYGSGTINRPVEAGFTTPGKLSPGALNATGTLALNAGVAFGTRGHFEVELGAAGVADRLTITGNLTIDPEAVLTVRALPGVTPSGDYLIATYTGVLSGEFRALLLPSGYTVSYATAGQVRLVAGPAAPAESIVYPADAGVLDVTKPPYNAVPNDGLDDTAAIQAALNAYPNGNRIIYLPNGTYDVSDTLSWPAGTPGATDYKRTILEGQSRNGAIIRLKNSTPAFASGAGKPVIYTGAAPAQRFRNSIRNLTVSIGTGNPGAHGVNFMANNQGTVRNVRIISEDGAGMTGLNLAHTSEIGPLMVQGLEVIGFDYGVRTGDAINGIVLENVRVEQQNVAGIRNIGQVFTLRGFTSINRVPAINNGDNQFGGLEKGGVLTVVDATLIGLDDAIQEPAIEGTGFSFLRNITSTGYARVFQQLVTSGLITVNDSVISERASESVLGNFPSKSTSLALPVAETPDVPWDALAEWANPLNYGAVANDVNDDTAGVQAAIDSGKGTVYFPAGKNFRVNGTLYLRGNVRRFIGTEGRVRGSGRLVFAEGAAPVVVVERFNFDLPIEHAATRTLAIRNVIGGSLTGTGRGDFFAEDCAAGPWIFNNPRQRIWVRQLNVESADTPNVVNNGATLWVLGMKTERNDVKLDTLAGGFTELLGFHNYSTGSAKTTPLLRVTESSASFAGVGESNFEGTQYGECVRETRGGITQSLLRGETPARTAANGNVIVLCTAYSGTPKAPVEFTAIRAGDTTATLAWADTAWNETVIMPLTPFSENGG